MTTPAPLPLSEICVGLSQDAERSAVIAAAAESILLANDEAHGELLRAFRQSGRPAHRSPRRAAVHHGRDRSRPRAAARLAFMP